MCVNTQISWVYVLKVLLIRVRGISAIFGLDPAWGRSELLLFDVGRLTQV